MQVNRILKSADQGKAFYNYILQYELYSLSWVSIVGAFYMGVFAVVDKFRVDHFAPVLAWRTLAFVLLLAAAILSFRKLSVAAFNWTCYLLSSILFVVGFMIDAVGGMPPFFLANYTCIFLFVFNATLGHPLRFKIAQTSIVFVTFSYYALNLSANPDTLVPQVWNIILNCSLSLLIGFLIERHKLLNYVQRQLLIDSRQRNEALNSLKTRLISVLSHDLAAPLNTLSGLIKLRDADNISAAEMEVHSLKVKDSLKNVTGLMQNLVRWSKSQLDGFNPDIQPVALRPLLDEASELVQSTAEQKRITIHNAVDASTTLMADQEILKIVVRNFLTNGIKFSNPGKTISVNARHNNGRVVLEVRDHGVGMSREQLDSIFSPGSTSTVGTMNERGTGVGLMITKDFVELMGGSIAVESKLGEGSVFSVSLPGA